MDTCTLYIWWYAHSGFRTSKSHIYCFVFEFVLFLLSRSVYCVYLKDKQQTFRIVFFCSCGFLCTVFLNICFYRFAVKYLKTCYNAVEGVFVSSINKRLCKIKAVKSKKYTSEASKEYPSYFLWIVTFYIKLWLVKKKILCVVRLVQAMKSK